MPAKPDPGVSTSGTLVKTATNGAITMPGHSQSALPSPSKTTAVVAKRSSGPAGFRVQHGDNSVPDFGLEAEASERQRAVKALTAYMRARAKGEWSNTCRHLARPTIRQLQVLTGSSKSTPDCAQSLAELLTGSTSERANTITNGVAALRVKEGTAFALFYGPNGEKYVMPMQNESGAWKMTQLAPLPYPLGTHTP